MKKNQNFQRKKKLFVKFQHSWYNEFKFIRIFQKGGGFTLCNLCEIDFSIEHGGENDSNRHKGISKHKVYVDAAQPQRKLINFVASSATERFFFLVFWLNTTSL